MKKLQHEKVQHKKIEQKVQHESRKTEKGAT